MERRFLGGVSMRPLGAIARLACAVLVALSWGIANCQETQKINQAPPPAPPADPTGPMWDMAKLSKPPQTWPAEGFSGQGVKAVFFQGPAYQGRETRVFAWIGLPDVTAGTTVPGVVLIHGGGGTAFDSWVRRWTSRVCSHCHGHLRMRAQRHLWALGKA